MNERNNKLLLLATAGALAATAAMTLASGCNTFDSPYEDAARVSSRGEAGSPGPVAGLKQSLSGCVNVYVESEAIDYFDRLLGYGVDCGSDPLFYLDPVWECEKNGKHYTVVRFSSDEESWHIVKRSVIPTPGTPWDFQCQYDDTNACKKITCKRI